MAKIETQYLVNGRKRFRGTLIGVAGDDVTLRRDNPASAEEKDALIPLQAIAEARLVLTDELIREALRRDKTLRAANKLDEPDTDQQDN